MGFFYLDYSVVVKRYVDEEGSAWVQSLITRAIAFIRSGL